MVVFWFDWYELLFLWGYILDAKGGQLCTIIKCNLRDWMDKTSFQTLLITEILEFMRIGF